MPILIRRISRTQWPTTFTTQEDDVSADAITNCLRTYTNALSFWEIANNSDLIKAIIALVSGPKQEKFSGIHVVSIDTNNPLLSELTVVPSLGDTTIVPLKEDHRDITNLTYNKIGIIKKLILEAFVYFSVFL